MCLIAHDKITSHDMTHGHFSAQSFITQKRLERSPHKSITNRLTTTIINMIAIVTFVAAFAAVAFAMVSPEQFLDLLVFVVHPNNVTYSLDHAPHMINVAIVTAMWTMTPTLVLVDRVLSARTYLGKLFVIASWVTSLFVIEEICNIELLGTELFTAVLVVAAAYLLAFLRFPLMIKIVFLLSCRIMGIILRTFSFVTRLIVKYFIRLILAPLVLQMLVKDFLQVMPTNLPRFGLIVFVGSSSAVLLYEIGNKLYQLALRGFGVLTDAIASSIVPLPPAADTSESSDYIARLPLVSQEETSVTGQSSSGVVENGVVPPPPRRSIHWLGDDVVSGHFVSIQEAGRRTACRKLYKLVDGNYDLQWRAQRALQVLVPLFQRFKRDNPLRLRSWSDYEMMFNECKLYEQGIDMIFLEMKLRAEFLPNPSLTIVQRTWEDAVDNAVIAIQEAAVEPGARAQDEADAKPRVEEEDRVEAPAEVPAVELEEPVAFDQPDAMEERELNEEEAPVEVKKRRRRRSEAAKLNSQLGSYWVTPNRLRRGTRVRRQPERYTP